MDQDNNIKLTFDQMPCALAELMMKVNVIYDYITKEKKEAVASDLHIPMSIKEACAFLGKGESTIYEKTSKRTIPFHKKDNKLYFYKDELIDWIEGRWNPDTTPITAQADDSSFEAHLEAMRSRKHRKADRAMV